MADRLSFEAVLPQDAAMPVKPTRDFNPVTSKRRVRIWLDAFMSPGDTERLLLMSEKNLKVSIEAE